MTYWLALLIFFGSACIAVGGLYLARRFLDLEKLRTSHEVSGYLIAVGGTIYGVLLGLIVVDAMAQGQRVNSVIEREVNALADVYIMASNLPSPQREQIRKLCKSYADQVPATEWETMSCGNYCPISQGMAVSLMKQLMNFEPKTENDKAIYPRMVDEASSFWQSRQSRLKEAEKGIPPLEMIALIIGAGLMMIWTYLFGSEQFRLQVTMTAMMAMLISLNFILLFMFAYPFKGDFSIKASSFQSLQEVFDAADKKEEE